MGRGGHRAGAGRPKLPKAEQAKQVTFRLYQDEIPVIREQIKKMHETRKSR